MQKSSRQAKAALAAIARSNASPTDKAIANAPYIASDQYLIAQIDSLQSDMRANEVMLLVAKNSELPQILHDAAVPDSPSGPDLRLNLAAGFIAGLLVGIVVASLRGRREPAAS